MNSKRNRIIFLMIVSSIFLLFYLCVRQRYDICTFLDITVSENGVENIRMIGQRVLAGTEPSLQDEAYDKTDAMWEIGIQEDWKEGDKHLFLPGHADLNNVYIRISCNDSVETMLAFDGTEVQSNVTRHLGTLEEGSHVVVYGANTYTLDIRKGSRLASMWINTNEDMAYILDDQDHTTSGTLKVLSEIGDTEYTGEFESLKGRGNSSWSMAKKSYGLKLTAQASLLGMTPGKSWVLSGSGTDATNIRNKLFYDMAVECGLKNAVESEWVDLYINGAYYGCYLLSEKITVATGRLEIGELEEKTELLNENNLNTYPNYKINQNGMELVGYAIPNNPTDITGGYLLETESYRSRFEGEPSRFSTKNGQSVVIQHPSYASVEQLHYISSFVQDFEDALYSEDGYDSLGKYYTEYIDLESFVQRYLIEEISKNIDAGYSSYYCYKSQGESKLYAGPVWDFDTALGNNGGWGDSALLRDPEGMYVNRANWSEQLWAKQDFQELTKEIFKADMHPYLEKILEEGLDEYIQTVYASTAMEQVYYGKDNMEEEFVLLRDFLQKRTDFLKEELRIEE